MVRAGVIALLLILSGCGAAEETGARLTPARPVGSIMTDTMKGTFTGAGNLVQRPLEDVGIKKDLIPETLLQLIDNPYQLPRYLDCGAIRKEIEQLDALLGPERCTFDQPAGRVSRNGEYIEEGAEIAQKQALGLIGNTIGSIPFRGLVRSISGANAHEKLKEKAYQAGRLRRAFLRGIASLGGPDCLCKAGIKEE